MLARPSSPPGKPSSTASGSSSAAASATSKSPRVPPIARGILLPQLNSRPRKDSTTASGSSSSSSSLTYGSHRLFGDPMVTSAYGTYFFLIKLYELVDDRVTDGAISWNDAGSGFIIHQPSLFEKELLPKYFIDCHTLPAFVRHLTTVLGFVKAGGDQLEFSRNDFRRGRPPLFDVHDLLTSRNADPMGGADMSSMTVEEVEKEHMFDKVVMPSDVGKLNRLVIPKHHAEKYFPLPDGPSTEKGLLLDFQDGNGKPWRFRYSYWNSSQCYVMTKGWRRFVQEKNLDTGDIISFQRGAGEDSRHLLFIDLKRRPTIVTHPDFPMALHLNLNTSLQPVSELSCVTTEADEIETTIEDDNPTFHDSEQQLSTPRMRKVSLARFLQKRADSLSSKKRSAVGEDDKEQQLDHRSSTFSSVMDDAVKGDSPQNICSSLDMLRQFVKEQVHLELSKQGLVSLAGTSSAKRIEGPGGRNLQLHFRTNLSRTLFTGIKVEGEQGAAVHVVLLEANSGHIVTSGPESSIKLDVVPLDGDFQYDDDDDWTQKEFQTHIVYEREGRRPLLTGDLQVTLKEGVGTLGDLAFTDNSNWTRSSKLRLGLKVASGVFEGIRIREAKSEAFRVKDHRNESYKKHFPPLLNDEVWRLEKIDSFLHGDFPQNTNLQSGLERSYVTTEADEIKTAYNKDKASEVVLKRFNAKRSVEGEDDEEQQLDHKSSTFSRVMDDAFKGDSLQYIFSSVEPMHRQLVREEVQHELSKLGLVPLAGRSSANRIEGSDGRNLQLHFRTNLSSPFFTGVKVEGEQGAAVHVVLLDANSGHVVTSGPESSIKLDVVALDGDFQYEDDEDWTQKDFQTHIVNQRDRRRPLLTGDLQVTLKEGVGTLGDLAFTDNSSWIRSGRLRLGLEVASGFFEGIRIREARTTAFIVKNQRGELYKKHLPPLLNDEVWRLEKISKDGVFHKRLNNHEIFTVEDFLHLMARDSAKLRNILGSGMSGRSWDALRNHAKTCVLDEKINAEEYLSVSSLSDEHIDTLVKKTFETQNDVRYDAKLHLNLKQSKGSSGSNNEYQGLTNIEEVQGAHTVGCAGRKDRHSNVWTVKGDQDHPIPLSVHADYLTRILGMRKLKVHNLFGKVPKSLPSIFQANSFVELHLPHYNDRLLWAGKLALVNLRLINLKHSSKLISLPDLSMAQKIVHLNLRGCVKLIQVSYIRNLTKLEKLNLSNCENIKVLPSLIGLQNLKEFYLSGCSNLWNLPPSIIALNSLVVLDLKNCAQLCELPRITSGLRSLQKLNISGCTNILRSLEMKGNRESQLLYGKFLNSTISGTYRYESASQFVEEATSPEQKKSTTKKAKKTSALEVVQVETTVEKELTIKNFNWKAKMEEEERKRKSVESAMTTCKEVQVKRICNNSDDFVSSICQPSHEAVEEAILDSGSKLIGDTEPAPPGRSSNLKENRLAGLAIEDATRGEGEVVGLGIQIEPEVISLCNSSDHPCEECSERVQLDISKTAAPCGPHKFAEKSCDGGMESNTGVFSHHAIETEPLSSYEENDEIDWLKNEIQKLHEQLEASEKRRDGFRECYNSLESELWPLCAELEVEHVSLKEQKQKHEESELEASNAWEDLKNLVPLIKEIKFYLDQKLKIKDSG